MNKDFNYQKEAKQVRKLESKSVHTRFCNDYPIFKDGFFNAKPHKTPYGFNFLLGYSQETIDMATARN